jgi:hypothetical protein
MAYRADLRNTTRLRKPPLNIESLGERLRKRRRNRMRERCLQTKHSNAWSNYYYCKFTKSACMRHAISPDERAYYCFFSLSR